MSFNPEKFDLLRIRRTALDRYSLHSLFTHKLSDPMSRRIHWAQTAASNINTVRAAGHDGAPPVAAGRIHAVTLLSEAYLRLMDSYRDTVKSDFFDTSINGLAQALGEDRYRNVSSVFLDEFPTQRIHGHIVGTHDDPAVGSHHSADSIASFQSMVVCWLHSINPALGGYEDLFGTMDLARHSAWHQWILELENKWKAFPPFGPDRESLDLLLQKPMREAPDSIEMQLRYISEKWRFILGDFFAVLLTGADMIREETRPFFSGGGPAQVPTFGYQDAEPESYSQDVDWMPSVVMLAKNTYVWLEQLSREFGYPIHRLDLIPDDALFQIARRGFNALWLIGLWSRSPASQQIKQMCGNPEAVASAYSVFDYRISEDLGGEDAFKILKVKAGAFGLRLAGDMVPNHMGIDSWWVCQHPEWFIYSEDIPFPQYTFNGMNLSSDPRCSIYLEDHYYSRSDAAVVFKYIHHDSGRTMFVYHGNDGTGLPWNDTAQLNFLRHEVREQVIRTIIEVASRFPIIRFDAAMTLAKKHYHRLWFPEPGTGGDIASRSRSGLSRQQFDDQMPVEFWREVVEEVARRAPDTLLLAEAFWLMEGYFVRTLGMHRVYNSAFMNMLSREDNMQYRDVIKNTIEFDPEIMKRYVNFMNNPDEEPAVVQFGKGDKYFGVCAMMSTLPGLPMFGHGQFEGFTEKYGMEYRRSYWNETPDSGLVSHHERVISPLLKRRRLFSGADNFRLYDFYKPDGTVNENVFAYSNRYQDQRGLFVFNNFNQPASGSIRMSAAWRQKNDGGDGELCREDLAKGLSISGQSDRFLKMFDQINRQWWIRRSSLIKDQGLRFDLRPYQCHAFIDIQEVPETEEGKYEKIERYLQGGGTGDIEETWRDMHCMKWHQELRNLSAAELMDSLDRMTSPETTSEDTGQILDLDAFEELLTTPVTRFISLFPSEDPVSTSVIFSELLLDLLEDNLIPVSEYRKLYPHRDRLHLVWNGLIQKAIKLMQRKKLLVTDIDIRAWRIPESELVRLGIDEHLASAAAKLTEHLVSESVNGHPESIEKLFEREETAVWIQVNHYRGTEYFNRESFEELLEWCQLWGIIKSGELSELAREAQHAGYRFKEFLDARTSSQ